MSSRSFHYTLILPAYQAARTLETIYHEIISFQAVHRIIIVDDGSTDDTLAIARSLPHAEVFAHEKNRGYGANQKTCFQMALQKKTDFIIMLHPDGQHPPSLLPKIIHELEQGARVVLASRMLQGNPLHHGMPFLKYYVNRGLTQLQNIVFRRTLSEYHSGYRVYSREILENIDFQNLSNDFSFDNEMLCEIILRRVPISEIHCPTIYRPENSSIRFINCVRYTIACLRNTIRYGPEIH